MSQAARASRARDEGWDRLLRRPDAARRLQPDRRAGPSSYTSRMASSITSARAGSPRRDLARRRLDEVGASGAPSRAASRGGRCRSVPSSLVSRITFRWARAAGLLDAHDLVETFAYRPERNAPRSITMSISSAPDATAPRTSRDLQVERRLPGREAGRYGRDLDARSRRAAASRPRRGSGRRTPPPRRGRRVARVGTERLRAERRDLAGRVLRPRASSGRSSGSRARAPTPSRPS